MIDLQGKKLLATMDFVWAKSTNTSNALCRTDNVVVKSQFLSAADVSEHVVKMMLDSSCPNIWTNSVQDKNIENSILHHIDAKSKWISPEMRLMIETYGLPDRAHLVTMRWSGK